MALRSQSYRYKHSTTCTFNNDKNPVLKRFESILFVIKLLVSSIYILFSVL